MNSMQTQSATGPVNGGVPNRGRFKELVVVITGASSGNGRATAVAFAREGASLGLAARQAATLDEVARECSSLGAQAIAVPTDVAREAEVADLARQTIARFGRIDVWVNCAAVLHFGRLEETPAAVLERVIATNVMGYFHGAQTAMRYFRQQHAGILINVCSVLGLVAQPYASAYVASKFAIRGLSDSIREEVRDEPGIHVCTVFPFAVDTPIYQHAANYTLRTITPIQPRYPAEDVAAAIVSVVARPRDEVHVGGLAGATGFAAAAAPRLTRTIVRRAVETMQIGRVKNVPSDGNVFEPLRDKWKIGGGWEPSISRSFERVVLAVGGGLAVLAWLSRRRQRRARTPAE